MDCIFVAIAIIIVCVKKKKEVFMKKIISKKKHTIIFASVIAVIVALVLVFNILATTVFHRALIWALGTAEGSAQTATEVDGLDVIYNKTGLTKATLVEAQSETAQKITGEGITLLHHEDDYMPYDEGTTFSFFGHSSVAWITSGSGSSGVDGSDNLKSAFEREGFNVNSSLWDFYTTGEGSKYKRGQGSISYGDAEDYSINECPLNVIPADVLNSAKGTTPVFVLGRVSGEGRDCSRAMYKFTTIPEDMSKHYLEPDSVELGIISYLNDNFDDVVVIINSSNAIEMGWLKDYENVNSVLFVPGTGGAGIDSLPRIMKKGGINPSGNLVDTFAADFLASPAAQNYGDFQYTQNGQNTGINYVTYKEGIYVGYKYYETRYEDYVLNQGNAGDFDYSAEVCYPFGYGLSYTDFIWSNFNTEWDGDICTVSVDVTNDGDIAGKDVVQIYAQSPYTQYDIDNKVEKSAVQLVGFAKTEELAPGATGHVEVSFDRELLKAYDYTTAKTYIFDAGTYYVTAAQNSHEAINNILSAKQKNGADFDADRMTAAGNTDFVAEYVPDIADTDITTYAEDAATGTKVENQFDFASQDDTVYLTRNNWTGTFPTADGAVSSEESTWGNQVNAADGKAYIWKKEISAEDKAQFDATGKVASMNTQSKTAELVFGQDNGLELVDMRGLAYDDPLWDELLDQLTVRDYNTLLPVSGYGSPGIDSINKAETTDQDGASGFVQGSGTRFPVEVMLAQTWNTQLAQEMGGLVGDDALLSNIDGWYAPNMNIHRTPFSGRNFEYYSEDGVFSGIMGSAELTGVAQKGVYCFIKHFAFNDQENHRGDRDGNGLVTWSNEQALREIYLKPFEMCVKSGTTTQFYYKADENGNMVKTEYQVPKCTGIMTAFNRIGFSWTGGNYQLLTNVLRNEWGFNGFVVSDFQGGSHMHVDEMIYGGGNGMLNAINKESWAMDKTNDEQFYYVREAAHGLLYTVANSCAMNGYIHGVAAVNPFPNYMFILIAVDVIAVVGVVILAVFMIRYIRKKDIPEQENSAKSE